MEWISVDERLPEIEPLDKMRLCNVWVGIEEDVFFAYYSKNMGLWIGLNEQPIFGITHWFPVPDSPTK